MLTPLDTIANLLNNGQVKQASKLQRRTLFQGLVGRIYYEPPPLLSDTVTELILERDIVAIATRQNGNFRLDGASCFVFGGLAMNSQYRMWESRPEY
ncbi:hypothetical protein I7I50_08891 [Histoplasma capsulatum G186AR]|uniref:Uncharacterized protein n=1 Tax=Ajellomyces capsulatus TaxID=5037 RepID=A0A8H8CZY0_AJECA|nr:hypothetical protein I7I52_06407 [Histoplasma capsulatum]QSS73937.1 hypothetical protein I7I50_08891 [Histoplasma capsulatum G186AR]